MNEFELIDLLCERAPRTARDVTVGVGDDCAVIAHGDHDLLITTDALVEGVHFTLSFMTPADLGCRMLNVNLSDIAAMGGRPRFFTIALGIPPGMGHERLTKLYEGIYDAAHACGAVLIGGDTTSSKELTASITVIGEVEKGKALLRSGARPGDTLFITGQLGEAALGLRCLRAERLEEPTHPFIKRYRTPTARLKAGTLLAASGFVTAMIDVSDGLMADVSHLARASGTGYEIMVDALPCTNEALTCAQALDLDMTQLMLGGGDDYELAFTVAAKRQQEFETWCTAHAKEAGVAFTRIGIMTDNTTQQVALGDKGAIIDVRQRGYDHLAGGGTAS